MSYDTVTGVIVRTMQPADISVGMRLREMVGWNQTESDWRRLLALESAGCFVACEGDRVYGTVTTLAYEKRFGWIGMLLTDPESRRRGIGTLLLHQAINYLEGIGVETVRLDGTPMGYNLYLRYGFVDEYEIQRWEGASAVPPGKAISPLRESDLEAVCRWDCRIFGADRGRLISSLWRENPSCSGILRVAGEITGYVLWRPGTRALYLGPCVAETKEGTEELLTGMLSRVSGKSVFMDMCTKNPWGLDLLKPLGFRQQRPLFRMYRGPHSYHGEPGFVCAIAGPEFG